MISHLTELGLIQQLQQIRTLFLDGIFLFLNFFDRQEFFFVLIPIVWIGYGWKNGFKLFYILFLSYLVNYGLKEFFSSPRPFHLDPSLAVVCVPEYGFPSGAAQTSVLLSGLFLRYVKLKWKWLIAIAYVLIISFSRIYLGVHFMTDILGGWIVGLILIPLVIYLMPRIEKTLKKMPPLTLFWISQIIPGLLLFFFPSSNMFLLAPIPMGFGLGIILSYIFQIFPQIPQTKKEYCVKVLVAVLGSFGFYAATSYIPGSHSYLGRALRSFGLALWLSLACHALFHLFWKKRCVKK